MACDYHGVIQHGSISLGTELIPVVLFWWKTCLLKSILKYVLDVVDNHTRMNELIDYSKIKRKKLVSIVYSMSVSNIAKDIL